RSTTGGSRPAGPGRRAECAPDPPPATAAPAARAGGAGPRPARRAVPQAGRIGGPMSRDSFLIAQLSDIHCGSPFFDQQLLRHAVEEVRALAPDLVLIGAELTCVVIPGNHDAKNVGYLHFTDSFGPGDVPGKGDRVLHLTGRLGPAA